MSMNDVLDFEGLAQLLLSQSRDLIYKLLPGGKLIGAEYTCGSLRGEPGDSLKVNINTGKWADFATNERGGDLISLYAAINGLGQGEAYRQLAGEYNFEKNSAGLKSVATIKESFIIQPPLDIDISQPLKLFRHRDYAEPSAVWFYRNANNEILFAIARYDVMVSKGEFGKQIFPWTWNKKGYWNCKGWPAPRPLFGLELLAQRPDAPVLICEGEKACMAARELGGHAYIVVTWPNGSSAINAVDWSPIFGRRILIWPDADETGLEAGMAIAEMLQVHCPEVKLLEVPIES